MVKRGSKGNATKPPAAVKASTPVYVGDIFDDEINDLSNDVVSNSHVSSGGRLSRGSSKRSAKEVKSSSNSECIQSNAIDNKKRIRRANQFYEEDSSIKSVSGNEIGHGEVDVDQEDDDGGELNVGDDDDEDDDDDDDDDNDDDDDDHNDEDRGIDGEDEEGQLEFVANKDHDVKAAIVQSTKGTSKGVFYACSSFHFGLSSLYFFNRVISSLWWLIRTYFFSL